MKHVKVVAEIGCNHNGDLRIAKELIKSAKSAGANAVKFQTFNATELVSTYAPKAEYQKQNTESGSQLEMLKELQLSSNEYKQLKEYSDSIGLECFSTAFDDQSIDCLFEIGQNVWKIPSGEITNLQYLERIAALKCDNKEIILSTGMSTMEDIHKAVYVLQKSENTKFTILHCNTEYPTRDTDVNLLAIEVLKEEFPNWEVGLSDHSEGIIAAITSVGLGVSFIEKHFTLDRSLPGPDHKASITPKDLSELCDGVKRACVMMGKKEKFITESERKNRFVARKSIVAKRNITKGEIFSVDNICCKRPGNGISPMRWYDVIGTSAERDFTADELISVSNIEWEKDE